MAMMCRKCKGKGPFKKRQDPDTGEISIVCTRCGQPVPPEDVKNAVAEPAPTTGPRMMDGQVVEGE